MTFRKKPRTFTFSSFEDLVDHQDCPVRGARDDDNVRGRSETQNRQEKPMVVMFRVSVPVLPEHSMSIQRILRWMLHVTQRLASLPKHEIQGPSLKCSQLAWKWELTPPQHYPKPKRLKIPKMNRSNTAMMNNTKNNDSARKKRENE